MLDAEANEMYSVWHVGAYFVIYVQVKTNSKQKGRNSKTVGKYRPPRKGKKKGGGGERGCIRQSFGPEMVLSKTLTGDICTLE